MTLYHSTPSVSAVPVARPFSWSLALARYTRRRREELGLSVERAAELAGLDLSEWDALESGTVPDLDDMGSIQAIAATLEIGWMDYVVLVLMASFQQGPPPEKGLDQQ
jgi:hypothetical protein